MSTLLDRPRQASSPSAALLATRPLIRRARNLLLWLLWRPLLRLLAPSARAVADPLPAGGCVVAASHSSHADTMLLQAALHAAGRRMVVAAAAEDYWFGDPVRAVMGAVLGGAVPMPRRGDAGLELIRSLVAAGWTVILYPQGSRRADAVRWRTGIGVLAKSSVPLVLARIDGAARLLAPGRRWPAPASTAVALAVPDSPPAHLDAGDTAAWLQACAERLDTPAARASFAERVSARLVTTAARRGCAVLGVWAAAEALVWPVIPDLALAGVAFAAPWTARRAWLATITASTLVGTLAAAAAMSSAEWPLPLVTREMVQHAVSALAADGPAALTGQPLSGVPYKAWAAATAVVPVELLPWAAWTLVARGARMAAVAALAAGAGALLRRLPPVWFAPAQLAVMACALGLFGVGWVAVVASWS